MPINNQTYFLIWAWLKPGTANDLVSTIPSAQLRIYKVLTDWRMSRIGNCLKKPDLCKPERSTGYVSQEARLKHFFPFIKAGKTFKLCFHDRSIGFFDRKVTPNKMSNLRFLEWQTQSVIWTRSSSDVAVVVAAAVVEGLETVLLVNIDDKYYCMKAIKVFHQGQSSPTKYLSFKIFFPSPCFLNGSVMILGCNDQWQNLESKSLCLTNCIGIFCNLMGLLSK